MNTELLEELLACALKAAHGGAAELHERYGKTLEIQTKTSLEDLVTDADVAAETKVREIIQSLRPNDAITGEELAANVGVNASIRWSIDPLDGTINYTRGLPFFSTSVAAADIQTGKWLAGAVVAPALGLVYFATAGGGSFKEVKGNTVKLSGPPKDRKTRIVATGFSYSASDRTEQFVELSKQMERFVDLRRLGSAALDACLVADGTVDAYFERHTKEYDWAAGFLIAEEAGLKVKRPEFVGDSSEVNFS
jgi:myo-inositol-1(or 4)-monophosphatase